MNRYRVLLPLLCLLLAAALPALGHEPPQPGGVLLEPGPDGLYSIPDGDRPPVPLESDVETESPFVLHSLAYEGGRLVATLVHAGEKPVTAVMVQVSVLSPEGKRLTATRKSMDEAYGADVGTLQRWRETGLVPGRYDGGIIYPGHAYRVELGGVPDRQPGMAEIGGMVLWVPMTIYLDASYSGSERLAQRFLGARIDRARILARWSDAAERALQDATTEMAALAALRSLEEEPGELDGDLLGQGAATQKTLLRNLDSAIGSAEGAGSARTELEILAKSTERQLRHLLEHVPSGVAETR